LHQSVPIVIVVAQQHGQCPAELVIVAILRVLRGVVIVGERQLWPKTPTMSIRWNGEPAVSWEGPRIQQVQGVAEHEVVVLEAFVVQLVREAIHVARLAAHARRKPWVLVGKPVVHVRLTFGAASKVWRLFSELGALAAVCG